MTVFRILTLRASIHRVQTPGRNTAMLVAGLLVSLAWNASTASGDWPTYRHDVERSGVTGERLELPLAEQWVFRPRHAPQPAWGDPKPVPIEDILELRRVHFDDVFQVAADEESLYFGSSSEDKLACLDLASGSLRWTYLAGGPIRLAPMLAGGRVYFSADDGVAYCLDARTGAVVWRRRAAPEDRRVLGHGRLISLWPSRTGVLVDGGTAYFAAGILPAERVFLYAADAADGAVRWCNDTTGEKPQSRISPQGYLMASHSTLYAPMGRVSPAAFARRDGRLLYETSFGKRVGGSYALLAGAKMFTGTEELVGFDEQTQDRFASFPGRKLVVTKERFYLATHAHLVAMDRASKAELWRTPCPCADELIMAGDLLLAGGSDQVMAVRADRGEVAWYGKVDGSAKGLAVSGGRLLVSTDTGRIHCFASPAVPRIGEVTEPVVEHPWAADPRHDFVARTAASLLRQTSVREGHCLVAGIETGQLAWELAKATQLRICAVTDDEAKAGAARAKLDAAGVYGTRVTVECWPLDRLPYADYFANLVVSESAALDGRWPGNPAALVPLVKPRGGTVLIGQPIGQPGDPANDPANAARITAEQVRCWSASAGMAGAEVLQEHGIWLRWTRGPLDGAGNWTHQYANLGNTACGDDQLVRAPLGVLWFGEPGPGEMPNRHVRAASPLSLDGRLFVQGEGVVAAYDAYNGVRLWRKEIPAAYRPNASHDGSNLAVCPGGLLVAAGDRCLRLDLDTGALLAEYAGPAPTTAEHRRWGFLATDGTRVYGTRAAAAGQSNALFALDLESGRQSWLLADTPVFHNTIVLDERNVYAVSSQLTDAERAAWLEEQRAGLSDPSPAGRADAERRLAAARLGRLFCLDRETGELRWQRVLDIANCGDCPAAMLQDGVLVLFGVYLDGHFWQQFFAGQFSGRCVTALASEDGRRLWSRDVGYRVRPLIIGDTLHAEPWAYDLKTGQPRKRQHPLTGQEENWQFARPGHHCGCPSASPHCLFFRSWNLGYYDLDGDFGTMHFAGQRPGCWINFIPAAGLALMSEASTGCMCDFPNMGTVVFQPVAENKAWAWYSAPGELTPVQQLALNLGAPGDRRDSEGRLWFGYPRPAGHLVMPLDGIAEFYAGGRFAQGNSVYSDVEGTADPWLYTSAALGLRRLSIPLVELGDGAAAYRVRLAFLEADHQQPGTRVFDIQLQGETVAAGFDIAARSSGRNQPVVAEFPGVAVEGRLEIELVARQPAGGLESLPLLQGVEVVRDRFLRLGCTPPSLVLNNVRPELPGTVRLVNLCDHDFSGRLEFAPPPGFAVSVVSPVVQLASGSRSEVSVTVSADGVAAGRHEIPLRLLREDGSLELERRIAVEHLGTRDRMVVQAIEDAHVVQRYATRNFGSVGVLLVDGGREMMNDVDHAQALFKFPLNVPGRPVRASLRIENAGNHTGDSGRVCLVEQPWREVEVTYANRPQPGRELARLERVASNQTVMVELDLQLPRQGELSLMIDPTSTDGTDYLSREGGGPAELVIEFEVEVGG